MDVILVINAGSSSIKFHAFEAQGAQLEPIAGGKIEEIYTNPRFTAKRQNGEVIEDKRWPEGERPTRGRAMMPVIRSRWSDGYLAFQA